MTNRSRQQEADDARERAVVAREWAAAAKQRAQDQRATTDELLDRRGAREVLGGREPRVMLVDDDDATRAMLRIVVRVNGIGQVIAEAETSEDANRLAAQKRPDIVVLDLYLADARGRAVFDGIRLASPTSRVVIFTAHETDHSWYESRGAVFVPKSARPTEIVTALSLP